MRFFSPFWFQKPRPRPSQHVQQRYAAWGQHVRMDFARQTDEWRGASKHRRVVLNHSQAVSELKPVSSRSIIRAASLTPDEKMRVAALIGQTLRMLGRVSACPTPSCADLDGGGDCCGRAPPKVIKPQAAAVSPAPPVSPPAMKARPLENTQATATVPPPSDTARVQVAAVPPRSRIFRLSRRPLPCGDRHGGSSSRRTLPSPSTDSCIGARTDLASAEVRETGTVPITDPGEGAEFGNAGHRETETDCDVRGRVLFVRQTQPGSYVIDTSRADQDVSRLPSSSIRRMEPFRASGKRWKGFWRSSVSRRALRRSIFNVSQARLDVLPNC